MIVKSLDPRIERAALDDESKIGELSSHEHFQTYEVFQQIKRGTHHQHVGSVHAPNAEMAMLFAKEQYCRRGAAVNLWVVKTADVFVTEYADSDIFDTTEEKLYRDPNSYKVMDRINAFKARNSGV